MSAVSRSLLVPHGFTLTVGGTLTILIGERGYPGWANVWAFVVSANVALIALTRAPARRSVAPSGPDCLPWNVASTVAVPAVTLATEPIGPTGVAFVSAGALATCFYVTLVTIGAWALRTIGSIELDGSAAGHSSTSGPASEVSLSD